MRQPQPGDIIAKRFGPTNYGAGRDRSGLRIKSVHARPDGLLSFVCSDVGVPGSVTAETFGSPSYLHGYRMVGGRCLGPAWPPGTAGYVSNHGAAFDEITIVQEAPQLTLFAPDPDPDPSAPLGPRDIGETPCA